MKCYYRVATERETKALSLSHLRMNFIKDVHPEYDLPKITSVMVGVERCIREYSNKNAYIGFLGIINGDIACSSGLIICNFSNGSLRKYCKIGYIVNFYTRREYRRRGYGYGLMEYVKSYARQNGFYKLNLTSTKEAYSLYKKCGYRDHRDFMEYVL